MKNFSRSTMCSDIDSSHKISINAKCRRLTYFAKIYSFFVILSMMAFVLGFFMDGKKQLILGGFVPTFNPFVYYFFIVLQTFVVYLEAFVIAGFDCCFCGLCLCFAVYFQVLACKFKIIGTIENRENAKCYVNHLAELRR